MLVTFLMSVRLVTFLMSVRFVTFLMSVRGINHELHKSLRNSHRYFPVIPVMY